MADNSFKVIDDGSITGIKEEIKFDWLADEVTLRTTYLPTSGTFSILDQNKAFQASHDGYSPTRELQHVASIPLAVIGLWIEKYGVDPTQKGHEVLLARLLNDPDWRHLRTGGGVLHFKE